MTVFSCPVCGERLDKKEKTYACPKGHSYDIAAEGYVHLLPPNRMHSKSPGDNKQMVAARRRFLEAGYYRLFSEKLNELVRRYAGLSPVLLDAGCGEGYYTGRLFESLQSQGGTPQIFGFDISKCAVKAAAKKYKGISFAVGSIFGIPVADGAVDCVTDIFAPIVEDELCRVLKPGGTLILAVPGRRHLFGLKEILYDAPYENEYRETEYAGFSFVERVPVEGDIRLENNETMMDLFMMTPYYYKTGVDGGERLRRAAVLETHIEFDFLIYKKVG